MLIKRRTHARQHKLQALTQGCGVWMHSIIKDEYHRECRLREVLPSSGNKTTSVKYAWYAYVCVLSMRLFQCACVENEAPWIRPMG